jgi:ammonium transporter, Amt family
VITPACGFVTAEGALLIGVAAGIVPWFFCFKVKQWFGYDDALDTFGVHAIGGTMGALLTGFLARTSANSNLGSDFMKPYVTNSVMQPLVWEQIKAIGVTLVLAIVGTVIIGSIVKAVIGLRPSEETESIGLDLAEHGEEGYHAEA